MGRGKGIPVNFDRKKINENDDHKDYFIRNLHGALSVH